MNKIRKICCIITNFIIFKWVADYLIATIQMMIENHWGFRQYHYCSWQYSQNGK